MILSAVICISLSAAAQKYNYGIGVRAGVGSWLSPGAAVDFRWNFNEKNSLHAIAEYALWDWSPGTATFSVLYEWNYDLGNPFGSGKGFNLYTGPGAHLGTEKRKNNYYLQFGVEGIVGVEYKFGIPLAVSVDFKPAFTFIYGKNGIESLLFSDLKKKVRYNPFAVINFGISVRYAF